VQEGTHIAASSRVIGFTGRFPGLLRTGSLIFKASRYREWFTGALEPYKHYIPVNYDLSDLEEKVAWVHNHPQIAANIAAESRKLAETRFRRQDIKCFTYRLLLEYQTLFAVH
jgi:Glycosyl transferase family 90